MDFRTLVYEKLQLSRGLRFSLWAFFHVVRIMRWKARRQGVVLESRLEW